MRRERKADRSGCICQKSFRKRGKMITSCANKHMKYIMQLQKKAKVRKQEKAFVVEGPKMVAETPRELLQQVYVSESFAPQWKGEVTEVVSDSVMKSISDTTTPQGVLAVVTKPEYDLKKLLCVNRPHLLLVEGVQDPGNLGTMFRTGEGAGVTGIILHKTTVDLFHPKTVRSTMGSIYRVPFFVAEDWEKTILQIKESGVHLYAAHLQGTQNYDTFDYTKGCGFFVGNEGAGLTQETTELAEYLLRIPMEGQLESLNAAMAAGILMYETARQRRQMVRSKTGEDMV